VADPRAHTPLCQHIHEARRRFLESRFPRATVEVTGSTRGDDFVRLLRAPVLFRDSQSSFGLWAGVANKGQVCLMAAVAV